MRQGAYYATRPFAGMARRSSREVWTANAHEPITIIGKRSNAVLISEDDWRSIQETLYLLSIPGMGESIRKGLKEPVSKLSKKPGW